MTSIFVAERQTDKSLCKTMGETLSRHFAAVRVHNRTLYLPSGNAELLISDLRSFSAAACDNTVIVFRDIQKVDFSPAAPDKTIAVVDSQNPRLMEYVSSTKLPAITCGLSPKDTITLSSIDTDSAVINLQRAVTCFGGALAESQEIPVRLNGRLDNFSLMAVAAVCILTGRADTLADICL